MGGLTNSPELVPGSGITLAVVLLTTAYMWSPTLAHLFTRLITREGWRDLYLRPQIKHGWRYWIAAWLLPAVLTVSGAVVFFLLFPQYFDPSLSVVRDLLATAEQQTRQPIPLSPQLILVVQIVQAIFLAPIINSLFTFWAVAALWIFLGRDITPSSKLQLQKRQTTR